ncbi:MAG: hypothetical protein LBB61_07720 [Treponema sp.]|nr:hypothetical protein [Treponema sp.]
MKHNKPSAGTPHRTPHDGKPLFVPAAQDDCDDALRLNVYPMCKAVIEPIPLRRDI